ncbi:MAG: hypothetical protein ACFFCS_09045 [Candidatus Hodarchaeota archaeon]
MTEKPTGNEEWRNTIESQTDTGATIVHKHAKRTPLVILGYIFLPVGFLVLTTIHYVEVSGETPRYGVDYTGILCLVGTVLFFLIYFWTIHARFKITTITVDASSDMLTLMRRYREQGKNKVHKIFSLKAIEKLKCIGQGDDEGKVHWLQMVFKDGRKKIILYGNNKHEVQELGNVIVKYF